MTTIDLLMASVVQVLLFSVIPVTWWFLKEREKTGFFQWIGMKKPIIRDKRQYLFSFLIATFLLLGLSLMVPFLVDSSEVAISAFAGKNCPHFSCSSLFVCTNSSIGRTFF